jgi:hypothetical protein
MKLLIGIVIFVAALYCCMKLGPWLAKMNRQGNTDNKPPHV